MNDINTAGQVDIQQLFQIGLSVGKPGVFIVCRSILTFTEPQVCKANISGTLSAPLSRMHKSSRLLNRLFSSKMTASYWPTMAIPIPASFRDSSARRRWMSLPGGTSVCHPTFSGVQFSPSFLRHLSARHYCALGRPRDPCSSD